MRRACLALLAALLMPVAASATSLVAMATTFTGDPLEVKVTLDDTAAGPGEVRFDLSLMGGTLADLRAVYLNLADDSFLAGLSVSGPDVTDFDASGGVRTLGGDTNVNGGGSPCPCDLGVAFGTPGMGRDDVQSTFFVLSHDTLPLSVDLFAGQLLAVRATSVGDAYGRGGSAKLAGLVPEPGALVLLAAAWVGVGARLRVGRRR